MSRHTRTFTQRKVLLKLHNWFKKKDALCSAFSTFDPFGSYLTKTWPKNILHVRTEIGRTPLCEPDYLKRNTHNSHFANVDLNNPVQAPDQ